jgi:hypothetical protein
MCRVLDVGSGSDMENGEVCMSIETASRFSRRSKPNCLPCLFYLSKSRYTFTFERGAHRVHRSRPQPEPEPERLLNLN